MTKLVLSAASSSLLRKVAEESNSNHHAVQQLKAALLDQPEAKMTAQSPAVPDIPVNAPERLVLEHTILISIASWTSTDISTSARTALKLSNLVIGSHVYLPPKPVFHRSKELESSLASIKRAAERAEYQRMSTSTPAAPGSYRIPSSYVNIAGIDPTLSLSQRLSASLPSQHSALSREGEEEAWKDAQRQLSVILNIFLSTLATAVAAWCASGNAAPGQKVLVSMLVATVTVVAEVVLYNRYHVYVGESKKIKGSRMKGSDVKGDGAEFKPLKLDRDPAQSSNKEKKAASASKKDPS